MEVVLDAGGKVVRKETKGEEKEQEEKGEEHEENG